jgi:voltage-gated potassium channel
VPFVVLDFNEDVLEEAREKNVLHVEGNGTEDEDLEEAGLSRARGLVTSSDSDADNLYITLSARSIRQSDAVLDIGDVMISEGTAEELGALEELFTQRLGR